MKGIGIIAVLIGIFVLIMIVRDGVESVKENPLQSSIETGKTIIEKSKEIIENNPQELENLGRPICLTNEDCLTLVECAAEPPCICLEGECHKMR